VLALQLFGDRGAGRRVLAHKLNAASGVGRRERQVVGTFCEFINLALQRHLSIFDTTYRIFLLCQAQYVAAKPVGDVVTLGGSQEKGNQTEKRDFSRPSEVWTGV
jgi:hypothetical protein